MNKCIGCGNSIDNKMTYCARCFKIMHYGQYEVVIKEKQEFVNLLDRINKTNALVVLVLDLFNLNPNLDIFKLLKNDILLVLTKKDLFKDEDDNKFLNYLKINAIDKIVISSNKNYNMDILMNKIRKHKHGKDVYVVGYTNSGKSTMINKIIKNYTDKNICITTSNLPNTTIDEIVIAIDNDLTLIDTPGIMDVGNIYYKLGQNELKLIVPKGKIRPISYQVKKTTFFKVDKYLRMDVNYNNVIFFMSNNLKIDRYYQEFHTDLIKKRVVVNKNEDLVISGLGFIKFTKKETIDIYVMDGVNVYTRRSLI